MYIPQGFMGTFGGCITASVTSINGNGVITTGSFISGSDIYDYAKFEMSSLTDSALTSFTASLNIISGAVSNVNLLIVGGGAGGGSTGSIFPVGSTLVYDIRGGGSPGGGGGVVYYDNLTLSPGTYEIGVGAAAKRGTAGGTNTWTGSNGNDSYFTYNQPWPTFNNNKFIAYGGGYGGGLGYGGSIGNYYSLYAGGNFLNANNTGTNSSGKFIASAGGVVVTFGLGVGFPGNAFFSPNTTNGSNGLGGFTGTNQGNNSGYVQGGGYLDPGGYDGTYIAGAGGAGSAGESLGSGSGAGPNIYGGNGGVGVTYKVANTPILLSGGGAGRSSGAGVPGGAPSNVGSVREIGTRGSTSYGAGGNSFYFNSNSDTNSIGNAGLVYIEWKRCIDQKCDTVDVSTLSAPLTMSFIKCGESTTSSLLLDSFEETTICTLSGSISVISGPTATFQSLGNCLNYTDNPIIPIPPQYTFLRYDVDVNCNLSNATQVWSLTNYSDGFYTIGGTLYRLEANIHTTYTIQITTATPSSCTPPPPPFPLSGSLRIWNDTTSLTGSIWYDKSGFNNHGLVSGSALSLSGSLGYAFNGTDNYVTYPITLNTINPTDSYTLQYYGSLPSESLNRDFFTKEIFTNGWDTIYEPSLNRFIFRDQAGQDKRASFTPVCHCDELVIPATIKEVSVAVTPVPLPVKRIK
jgi:hypothetical protein